MALSLAILMLFLALGSGTAVWAAEATGSSTLEQHLEKGYVTQQDLRSAPHNVETEDAAIPAKYFEFVCVNHHADGSACTDLQTASISSIKGGRLRNNVPLTLKNNSDVRHTFSRAHIGNTAVYFVGTLTILEDDGTEQEYIYYTTDKNVTNKTAYAVLKNGDKITLEYTHGKDHTVEYQFKDSDGKVTSEGPDGWSLDQVFGADRPLEVADGHSYSDTVTIPRGYKATVSITRKSDGEVRYTSKLKLGEMMSYQRDERNKNRISLVEGSPDTIKLSDFISLGNIKGDDVVTLQYEKIDQFTFDASKWAQTVYANRRMVVYYDNNNAEFGNDRLDLCKKTFSAQDHSFSWDFWGWTADGTTWELDQLQINGEPVTVPMVDVTSDKTVTETTTLSTGTKITISVTSNQKEVGSKAIRYYRMDVENCYENLTVSAGNLVGHRHKELVFKHLNGVNDPEYYKIKNGKGDWIDLKPGSLVERASGNNYIDPIRFKKADGYQMPHISYTKKDGTKLQEDDLKTGDVAFVEYLIKNKSDFEIVPYENWQASSDGYYYFRGTEALQKYMNADLAQGVVLVNIQASPIKYGINYVSGAGRTQDGVQISPNSKDIEDMTAYQNGGENGYNCENHQKVLISNQQPVDKTGSFIFDHWEVLTAETRDDGTGHPTETVKRLADGNPLTYAEGESLQCSGASIAAVQDCLYYDRDKDRKILTLRAVWKKREEKDAIPYMVNFYVSYKENGEPVTKKIKSRTHMVNPGARVVADLYQYEDGKKQLSANIQNVLSGDNETGSAYDGEYRIDDVNTMKGIDNVTVDNNTVNIYLVKVEKEDPSKPSDPVPAPPTDPSKPSDPVTPTDPSQPTDSSQQTTSAATSSAQSSSQQTADDAAATGDNFAPVLWIAIAAAALAGIGVVLAGSRRKKQ